MKNAEKKMNRAIEVLENDLASIRAGRANPAILDKVTVEYYGVQTPLQQVGTVSVPEARTIVIQPWDATLLGAIEKAIQTSDVGINPNNDGKVIRLNFPPLTEERRKEFVKECRTYAEESRVAVRNARRDANTAVEKAAKNDGLPEDEQRRAEAEIQKLTDAAIAKLDAHLAKKEEELMSI